MLLFIDDQILNLIAINQSENKINYISKGLNKIQYLQIVETLLDILETDSINLSLSDREIIKQFAANTLTQIKDVSKTCSRQEEVKSIFKMIKITCKAILWEINQYKINNINFNNSSWKLLIGEYSYEILSAESKNRIHLLGED